jgi:hypothetical protein
MTFGVIFLSVFCREFIPRYVALWLVECRPGWTATVVASVFELLALKEEVLRTEHVARSIEIHYASV